MNMRAHQAYATTQRETAVASARPAELVAMVYERLLEHLRTALLQMAEGQDPVDALTKALELITTGLQACLDMDQGGEIAANLDSIYDWASREILRARLRRDPAILRTVMDTLTPLAEAWRHHAEPAAPTMVGHLDLGATAPRAVAWA